MQLSRQENSDLTLTCAMPCTEAVLPRNMDASAPSLPFPAALLRLESMNNESIIQRTQVSVRIINRDSL
jgi:hypothetical protein